MKIENVDRMFDRIGTGFSIFFLTLAFLAAYTIYSVEQGIMAENERLVQENAELVAKNELYANEVVVLLEELHRMENDSAWKRSKAWLSEKYENLFENKSDDQLIEEKAEEQGTILFECEDGNCEVKRGYWSATKKWFSEKYNKYFGEEETIEPPIEMDEEFLVDFNKKYTNV